MVFALQIRPRLAAVLVLATGESAVQAGDIALRVIRRVALEIVVGAVEEEAEEEVGVALGWEAFDGAFADVDEISDDFIIFNPKKIDPNRRVWIGQSIDRSGEFYCHGL